MGNLRGQSERARGPRLEGRRNDKTSFIRPTRGPCAEARSFRASGGQKSRAPLTAARAERLCRVCSEGSAHEEPLLNINGADNRPAAQQKGAPGSHRNRYLVGAAGTWKLWARVALVHSDGVDGGQNDAVLFLQDVSIVDGGFWVCVHGVEVAVLTTADRQT